MKLELPCALLAATLAIGPVLAAPRELGEVGERVERFIDERRARAEVGELIKLPALDRLAAERARAIAALPHRRRLAYDQPLGESALREAGLKRYRSVATHTDMHRGYLDHASAFSAGIERYPPAAARIVDPEVDAIGAAAVRADDGWVVLVVLFVVGYEFRIDAPAVERDVVDEINRIRASRGLVALEPDRALARVARAHSRDMARHDYFGHADRDGGHVGDRVRPTKLRYRAVAENLFMTRGHLDPAVTAARGWMESAGHRDNILTDGFRQTGVGVAVREDGSVYITQLFLEPVE